MTDELDLILPHNYDEIGPIVESKGVFWNAFVEIGGRRREITFYDPVRLMQDIEAESASGTTFFAQNIVVLSAVTRENMEAAIKEIGSQLFPGED